MFRTPALLALSPAMDGIAVVQESEELEMSTSSTVKPPPLFIFAFVAKGPFILVEYSEFAGNFRDFSLECLRKLTTKQKFKYSCPYDLYTYNFLGDNGYVFHVMADSKAGLQLPFILLAKARDSFFEKYGLAADSRKQDLSEFRLTMQGLMHHCTENSDDLKRQARVQQQTLEALKATSPQLNSSIQVSVDLANQRITKASQSKPAGLGALCIRLLIVAGILIALAFFLAWLLPALK